MKYKENGQNLLHHFLKTRDDAYLSIGIKLDWMIVFIYVKLKGGLGILGTFGFRDVPYSLSVPISVLLFKSLDLAITSVTHHGGIPNPWLCFFFVIWHLLILQNVEHNEAK